MFLAFVSVPLWVIFELYNKYTIHNWHYIGLPEIAAGPLLGYAWSFATIWPAIFETGELVSRAPRSPRARRIGRGRLRRHHLGVVGLAER